MGVTTTGGGGDGDGEDETDGGRNDDDDESHNDLNLGDDMDQFYNDQESIEMQRAIISSVVGGHSAPSSDPLKEMTNLPLGRTAMSSLEGVGLSTPNGSDKNAKIPRIRDMINSMASQCYLALEALSDIDNVFGSKSGDQEGASQTLPTAAERTKMKEQQQQGEQEQKQQQTCRAYAFTYFSGNYSAVPSYPGRFPSMGGCSGGDSERYCSTVLARRTTHCAMPGHPFTLRLPVHRTGHHKRVQ